MTVAAAVTKLKHCPAQALFLHEADKAASALDNALAVLPVTVTDLLRERSAVLWIWHSDNATIIASHIGIDRCIFSGRMTN